MRMLKFILPSMHFLVSCKAFTSKKSERNQRLIARNTTTLFVVTWNL